MSLPKPVYDRITRFLDEGQSGTVQIDVSGGQVTGVRVTEITRLGKHAIADTLVRAVQCD